MSTKSLLSILAAQKGGATRLGWISSVTGITYCGICLRSPIEPRLGSTCECCSARVVGLFDPEADAQTVRNAWRKAGNMHA